MASAVTWILLLSFLSITSSQTLRQYQTTPLRNQGICRSKVCQTLRQFHAYYKDCIVVIGTLQLTLLELTDSNDFVNITFPNMREVTDFFVVYRVNGLRSLGQLFPNLSRIRGEKLLNNYGLIVHDMMSLEEIGLYGLVKIDRGGVMIWGVQEACFIDSIDWRIIVPQSRLVISPQDKLAHCNFKCTCSLNSTVNRCWNNMKCQIYLEGSEADNCHDECLGCRKTNSHVCYLCRHYTHNGKCVSQCPSNTILLPNSQYCITSDECDNLDGWTWNNTCVFHCPLDYIEQNTATGITCKYCPSCHKTCQSLDIWAVGKAQEAEGCVFVNGSLEIHIRPVPEVMAELTFLNRIQEVADYIAIYSSTTITSLSFLSSLKRIKGRNLKNGQYSLVIHNMENLRTLFTKKVTKNLKIDEGTLKMYANPALCKSQIDTVKPLFPIQPDNETDIPTGMNGYSGDCEESVGFQVRVINETSVSVLFPALSDPDAHYSILYVRLPSGTHQNLVPETCSEFEWYVFNVETSSFGHPFRFIELKSLLPASTYAICIETYDPVLKILARSNITNFTTPVGKPKPPFMRELIALTSTAVVVGWVDHEDYLPFISHYELDVSLIEINASDIIVSDQCKYKNTQLDKQKHAIFWKLPPEYARGCACEVLSNETVEEDHFDHFVCSSINCDIPEDKVTSDSFYGKYIKTKALNFKGPRHNFTVQGLAPFRGYRFRLRACTDTECSRFTRGVVKTLISEIADLPAIVDLNTDGHGNISIKWNPPKVTNGPILAFSVEVVPFINHALYNHVPQTWCLLPNMTSHKFKTIKAKVYSVRVCTRSMAFEGTCTEWVFIEVSSSAITLAGVVYAITLFMASIITGLIIKRRAKSIDLDCLLECSDNDVVGESEPPNKMFSDFAEIPLGDTELE